MGLITITSHEPATEPVNGWPQGNSWQMVEPIYQDLVALNEAVAGPTFGGLTLASGGITATTPLMTTPVATVSIVEYSTGRDMVSVMTLTNFIVGALAGAAAALGVGNIVCALPAGAALELVYYSSLSLKCAGTATACDTGLGSVIASGAVSVLDGTATFEDRMTGVAISTSSTGGTAVASLLGATAGIGTGISLNDASSIKNMFLNAAGTWHTNNTGNLTATGTVVVKWTKMA